MPQDGFERDVPQELMAPTQAAMMISGLGLAHLMTSGIDFGVGAVCRHKRQLGKAFVVFQVAYINRSSPIETWQRNSGENSFPQRACAHWIMSNRLHPAMIFALHELPEQPFCSVK